MDENNNSHTEAPSQRDRRLRRATRWAARTGIMAATGTTLIPPLYQVGKRGFNRITQDQPESTNQPNEETENVTPNETETPKDNTAPPGPSALRRARNSRPGQIAEKGTKNVLMYTTPGGFLLGKVDPGGKQIRAYAKGAAKKVEAGATKSINIGKQGAQKSGKLYWNVIPLGWATKLGKKYLPQSIKDKASAPIKKWRERRDMTPYQRAWNDAVLSKSLWSRFRKPAFLTRFQNSKLWKIGKWPLSPGYFGLKKARRWKQERHIRKNSGKWADDYMNAYANMGKSADNNEQKKQSQQAKQIVKNQAGKLWRGYQNTTNYTTPKGIVNRFVGPRASNLNRNLGRKLNSFGKNAAKNAAKQGAKNLGNKIAQQAVMQGIRAFFATPPGWITIGVILLIIFAVAMVMVIIEAVSGGGGNSNKGGSAPPPVSFRPATNPIPGFLLTKAVDKTQANYPDEIHYTITYSYSPPTGATIQLSDITVYDTIPSNTTLVNTNGVFDTTTNTVTWDLANITSLELVIKPTQDNITIKNQAYAVARGNTGGGTSPTTNDCNGFYAPYFEKYLSPYANFGDPNCTLAGLGDPALRNNAIAEAVKAQDPKNADFWLNILIPCESTYNPNAFNGDSTSGNGAYGLFQMNPAGKSTSGQYDVANVDWPQQIVNATSHAKAEGGKLNYWDARCTQGRESLQY